MEELIDKVIEEIKRDIENQDVSALAVLLESCPRKDLEAYLPEDLSEEIDPELLAYEQDLERTKELFEL